MKKENGSVMEKAEVGNGERGRAVPPPGESKEQEQGAKSKEVGVAVAPGRVEVNVDVRGVVLRSVGLCELEASATNPRKSFPKESLEELAASIRAQGIVQPLVIRLKSEGKGQKDGARYEVVAGGRRLRAAKLAGLTEVPCLVRSTMSDREVLEVQWVENLQREDVSALEEAEGFKRLIEEKVFTVEALAERLGKSRGHVFNRLRLARASKAVKSAVCEGGMPQTLGNLVCQLPTPELQQDFLNDVGAMDGEWLSFRSAQDVLQRSYMRDIKAEHFDAEDGELAKAAGKCSACPKRSGNMPGVEGKNPNVCTDVECYEGKCKAMTTRREGEALKELQVVLDGFKAKGFKTLGPESARGLFTYDDVLPYQSEYVRLNDVCRDDGKGRTYKELLGELKGSLVVAVGRHGKAVKLYPKKEVPELLKAAGHKFLEEQELARKKEAAEAKERVQKSQAERDAFDKKHAAEVDRLRREEESQAWREKHAMTALVAGLEKPLKDETVVWRLLAEEFIHAADASALFWRRDMDGNAGVAQLTKGMKLGQVRGFMLEAFLCDYDGYDVEKCEALAEAAGLDWGRLMKAAQVAYAAEAKVASATATGGKKVLVNGGKMEGKTAAAEKVSGGPPVGKVSPIVRAKLEAAARVRWAKAKNIAGAPAKGKKGKKK